jgi:hypothetical protein
VSEHLGGHTIPCGRQTRLLPLNHAVGIVFITH